jgi:hypothetical protein
MKNIYFIYTILVSLTMVFPLVPSINAAGFFENPTQDDRDKSLILSDAITSNVIDSNSNIIANIKDPISLSLPKACVFADGLTPKDPENCVPIINNEETGVDDNIFFNLRSDEAVDNFKCELRDRNGALVPTTVLQQQDNPTDCTIDANNMEIIYKDLPDGTYSFTVIATKQEETILDDNDGNNNNVVQLTERTGKSPPFNFIVGTGSGFSGGAGFSADRTDANLETSNKVLHTVIDGNGKAEFSNLEYLLKHNITAKPKSMECFYGVYSDSEMHMLKGFESINCLDIFVFANQMSTKSFGSNNTKDTDNSTFSNTDIYTVSNAIATGINGPLLACGETSKGSLFIQKMSCDSYFIVYS